METVRSITRKLIRAYPTAPRLIWQVIYPQLRLGSHWAGEEYADRKNAFATIYDENRWGSPESVSGRGSTLESTGSIRSILPQILKKLQVRTFLDAPCGDFNWARHLQLPAGVAYIGGDIVDALIENLQAEHADETHRFITLDIVDGQLPAADLWLCRHVLFHLSTEDIMATLANFASSSVEWILTDSLATITNSLAIKSGGFRLVNLEAPPFNLPKPSRKFPDYYPPDAPVHLCLWSRDEVAAAVSHWQEKPAQ